jgi:hypothetical protein
MVTASQSLILTSINPNITKELHFAVKCVFPRRGVQGGGSALRVYGKNLKKMDEGATADNDDRGEVTAAASNDERRRQIVIATVAAAAATHESGGGSTMRGVGGTLRRGGGSSSRE